MSTPLIGITSYLDRASSGIWDLDAVFLPWEYGSAFVGAGAAIAVLPPQDADPAAVDVVMDRLDGLVITGGADLDATLYGQAPHPHNDEPRPARDQWELALTARALERGVPFFGICRGAQVLNVARGGTLVQHLPDVVGNRDHEGEGDRFGLIDVETVEGTRIAELHPARSTVPVYHHQAIDRVGEGLVVGAYSIHGIAESVEDPRAAFCLGVQWHPERDDRPALFDAFVAAARRHQESRAA